MLVCEEDGHEVGYLVYDDLREGGVNVNGISFDETLPDGEKERVARSLLEALIYRTKTLSTPRLSFTRRIRGLFWASLERDHLILIDPYVERLS